MSVSTPALTHVACGEQATQADYRKQKQDILAAFAAAKAEVGAVMASTQQHFDSEQADARLAFETAKAEAQNKNLEDYNVLKLSLEAQVLLPCIQPPRTLVPCRKT